MDIDLTAPSEDLGIQLIIEATTDPAVRQRVATDPTVLAIATRAVGLPDEQRQRISDLYDTNFGLYRVARTQIKHRVRHAGGPDHLTTRALDERLHDLLDRRNGLRCAPHNTCRAAAFPLAVMDMIYAHLARGYLTADEQRLFTAPWIDVVGPTPTPVN